jgi:hypothetical protein
MMEKVEFGIKCCFFGTLSEGAALVANLIVVPFLFIPSLLKILATMEMPVEV